MNKPLLKGILVAIIAINLFMMFMADSPYSLATLGISLVCFSIILFFTLFDYFFPKPPYEWTNSRVKNLAVFRPLRPSVEPSDQVP